MYACKVDVMTVIKEEGNVNRELVEKLFAQKFPESASKSEKNTVV